MDSCSGRSRENPYEHFGSDYERSRGRVATAQIRMDCEEASAATEWLSEIADFVEPKQTVDMVKGDPDDNRIIECALAGKADYLITGDKHLLDIKQFGNCKIIKPAEFAKLGQGRG